MAPRRITRRSSGDLPTARPIFVNYGPTQRTPRTSRPGQRIDSRRFNGAQHCSSRPSEPLHTVTTSRIYAERALENLPDAQPACATYRPLDARPDAHPGPSYTIRLRRPQGDPPGPARCATRLRPYRSLRRMTRRSSGDLPTAWPTFVNHDPPDARRARLGLDRGPPPAAPTEPSLPKRHQVLPLPGPRSRPTLPTAYEQRNGQALPTHTMELLTTADRLRGHAPGAGDPPAAQLALTADHYPAPRPTARSPVCCCLITSPPAPAERRAPTRTARTYRPVLHSRGSTAQRAGPEAPLPAHTAE